MKCLGAMSFNYDHCRECTLTYAWFEFEIGGVHADCGLTSPLQEERHDCQDRLSVIRQHRQERKTYYIFSQFWIKESQIQFVSATPVFGWLVFESTLPSSRYQTSLGVSQSRTFMGVSLISSTMACRSASGAALIRSAHANSSFESWLSAISR